MDSQVTTAIITAVGGACAAGGFLTYVGRLLYERYKLKPILPEDRRDIDGTTWEGTAQNTESLTSLGAKLRLPFPITCTFHIRGRKVVGECSYQVGDHTYKRTLHSGSFHDKRLFRIDYRAKRDDDMAFGTIIFRVYPGGGKMDGMAVLFGVRDSPEGHVAVGTINLTKKA